MLVLLNSRANYGSAGDTWRRVRPKVGARLGGFDTVDVTSSGSVDEAVRKALEDGERTFIAAGGDGTVNSVASALLKTGGAGGATLGAIGLGSSNDFHKPFSKGARAADVPVRIDCGNAKPQDVIQIEVEDGAGGRATRYAVMNASLGITATANAHFNEPSSFVRGARRLSMDAAIVASVIETLVTFRDIPCRLRIDGSDEGTFSVSNLGVIKNPHFAGTFCYDTPIEPDDGRLGVNLCERLTPFQALATLAALRRRRFAGRPKTRSWLAARLRVEADETFTLETDGEVARVRSADFAVLPGALRCCT